MKKIQLWRAIRFRADELSFKKTEVVVTKECWMDVIPRAGERLGWLPICEANVVTVLHGAPMGYLTLSLSVLYCDSEEAVESSAVLYEDRGWERVTDDDQLEKEVSK